MKEWTVRLVEHHLGKDGYNLDTEIELKVFKQVNNQRYSDAALCAKEFVEKVSSNGYSVKFMVFDVPKLYYVTNSLNNTWYTIHLEEN